MKSRKGYAILSGLVIFTVLLNLGCVSEKCGDGVCDPDIENCVTCPQDCGACATETNCNDGIDNDNDGLVDCEDTNCALTSACLGAEVDCSDQLDNDNDGLVDCDDSDCASTYACQEVVTETNCNDNVDNDNDGSTDCADSDCASDDACISTSPDLEVTDIEFPNEVLKDAPMKITAVITNNGAKITDTYAVRLYYLYSGMINDLMIASINLPGVHEPLKEKRVSVIWSAPQTGELQIRVIVDYYSTVDEENEDNNELWESKDVVESAVFCPYAINSSTKMKLIYRTEKCQIGKEAHITGISGGYAKLSVGNEQYTIINGKTVYFKEIRYDAHTDSYEPWFNINGKDGELVIASKAIGLNDDFSFTYGDMNCHGIVKSSGVVWLEESSTCNIVSDLSFIGSLDGEDITLKEGQYALVEEHPLYLKKYEVREYGQVEEDVLVTTSTGETAIIKNVLPGEQFRPIFELNGQEIVGEWLEIDEESIFAQS